MTTIQKTQQRIQRIEHNIDRVKRQTTLGESGDAMKRAQLRKLETQLTIQKRKLAHLEAQRA